MDSNEEGPQFEAWVEQTLNLRMNAEAIVADRTELRTPYLWAQYLSTIEGDRSKSSEAKDKIVDEMILSMAADINGQILRTLSYENLKEKHGDSEMLYMAILGIVSTAIRYALPYLGDYDKYSDPVLRMKMRVERELYRKLDLPLPKD